MTRAFPPARFDGDLRRADFSNATMPSASLSGDARNAIFAHATLTGAVISGRFDDADFSGATLNSASFTDAVLSGANFTGASLRQATNLVDVCIPGHDCELSADLTGAAVVVNVREGGTAHLESANLSTARITVIVDSNGTPGVAQMGAAILTGATADLEGPNLKLANADLSNASLQGFVLLNGSGPRRRQADERHDLRELRPQRPCSARR